MNDPHIIAPSTAHTHTIILLHGRDSNAKEFADEFFESQISDGRTLLEVFPTIKWVFPTAALRKSERFDMEMSQWFDMWSVEDPHVRTELQIPGLNQSVPEILNIISQEARIICSNNIIIGGISQGCATAAIALLCGGVRLGGFLGFCGWLPFRDDIARFAEWVSEGNIAENIGKLTDQDHFHDFGVSKNVECSPAAIATRSVLQTPIFISHAEDDEVVPVENGRLFTICLDTIGFEVTWKVYEDGGHWINEPSGVEDIVAFIDTVKMRSEPNGDNLTVQILNDGMARLLTETKEDPMVT